MKRHSIGIWFERVLAWIMMAGLASAGSAEQIRMDAELGSPLLLAGKKQTVYLKVGLTGFRLRAPEARPPANIAIVLDKSGSMSGEKIAAAREAAITALERLSGDDIVSVITYDTTVHVLVPATRLSDREEIYRKIRGIEAGGTTALFAGVSKGSTEIHKFMNRERVNRIVLLSDGIANVGPSSPGDLAELGSSLGREGIAVTTIGLGLDYNEDLMARLAATSNGRHYFAREASQLARIYDKEFGDVMRIVAQEVVLEIECAGGVRPVRVLGRGADIHGQNVRIDFNQLYAEHERYAILETELEPGQRDERKEVARVRVAYDNMQTKTRDKLESTVGVRFTDNAEEVKAVENRAVKIAVVEQIGSEQNAYATELRDKGKIEEARKLLGSNRAYLYDNAQSLGSFELRQQALQNDMDAQGLNEKEWLQQRKQMRENQVQIQGK